MVIGPQWTIGPHVGLILLVVASHAVGLRHGKPVPQYETRCASLTW